MGLGWEFCWKLGIPAASFPRKGIPRQPENSRVFFPPPPHPGKFWELLLLSLLRDFLRIPGTARGWSLWNDGRGRAGMFPAWNCGSHIPIVLFSLRESGSRPGRRGCAEESLCIPWNSKGFTWDFGIPGVQVWNSRIREGFLGCEMLFPPLLFPAFPRAAVEWVVLELLPQNPWDSLLHPKIPGV